MAEKRLVERRKHFRYLTRMDIKIEVHANASRVSSTLVPISDISLGGLFVITPNPIPIGAELNVLLPLEPNLRLRCAVRQVVPGRGMGVEFLEMAPSCRSRLQAFLESLAEPSLISR